METKTRKHGKPRDIRLEDQKAMGLGAPEHSDDKKNNIYTEE